MIWKTVESNEQGTSTRMFVRLPRKSISNCTVPAVDDELEEDELEEALGLASHPTKHNIAKHNIATGNAPELKLFVELKFVVKKLSCRLFVLINLLFRLISTWLYSDLSDLVILVHINGFKFV